MKARTLAALALIAMPVVVTAGDLLRLGVESATTGDGSTLTSVVSQLEAVDAHRTSWAVVSWSFYVGALLTIPMTLLLWRLAVGRAPTWAWAGAVLGTCSVIGQVAHLMGYFGSLGALSSLADREAAADAHLALGQDVFSLAVFAPYLVGLLLAPAVQAVALRRARVVPLWAVLSVGVGAAVFVVFAGQWWASVVWGVGLVVGFLPAARAALVDHVEHAALVEQPAGGVVEGSPVYSGRPASPVS
ncbi:hypothetical protein ACQE98_00730 [Ornithinimicrobium sp. W1679]|uniref:hypothetical protein n=1 Tax=Ornithinimicrobium sp. W1679 TaxID=3418770 RepID=UPI003CF51EF3